MDIAAIATVAASAKVQQSASVLLMKKVMGQTEQNAQNLVQALAACGGSLEPHLGNTVDMAV